MEDHNCEGNTDKGHIMYYGIFYADITGSRILQQNFNLVHIKKWYGQTTFSRPLFSDRPFIVQLKFTVIFNKES